ncbi:hypothetical protein CHS0354_016948 [Potamilus streckersoni]|uniref:Uncharacterized protein n=1 Tax=Potamilus streckersoni TaxID=2493646 RepID=A0AAE0S7M3_9BIVA|nr:hypothetical protein CHS0354_016948 [Potamilus streckersoni]
MRRSTKGNIQIGDSSYELWAAESSDTSQGTSELPDRIGKRYLLLDQRYAEQENYAGNIGKETSVQEELKEIFGRSNGHGEQKYCRRLDATKPSRYVGNLYPRGTTDQTRQLKQNYYVKVALLIDTGVWDT